MNGTDICIDTNICIYLLDGDVVLAELLQGQNLYISIISEMELYAYHSDNADALQILDSFIRSVSVINIEEKVKIETINVRRKSKLKLPDSIIAASALAYNIPLITSDAGFKKVSSLDLIFYENF
ncbi:type II toxin-antitoxin system VapC family toxin [soil metagenome]|jgi:predicted nucleic acid-binding protein